MPYELLRYQYRSIFKLNAQEMADEPADQFFTNLRIWGLIEMKKEKDLHRESKHR